MIINWHKLAEIKELKIYFDKDFDHFKNKIHKYLEIWQKIDSEDLDKLALLRALEVTNGCTQWAFRRGDKDCLSLDKTRQCMQLSMSSIKNKEIKLNNHELITFSSAMEELIEEGRSLYIDAFKNNISEQEEEFYALSTAQFIIYGEDRLNKSFQIIRDNYQNLFTDFFINKGIKYVQPYLQN